MNVLILFSGTKSFSKILLNDKNKDKIKEIRTVDLDNTFKPTYNVNILEWDYKKDLKDYKVDYLHSSPVCKEFSKMKNVKKKRDLELGYSLVDKTIEIIDWIKNNNNDKLKFTIENPKTKFTLQYSPLMNYDYVITSYCMYGFLYQKDTTFWYGGFQLKLKEKCNKKNKCYSKSINDGVHKVRIGLSHNKDTGTYKRSNQGQIGDILYFKELRKIKGYEKYTNQYFRFRLPPELIQNIINCLLENDINDITDNINELVIEI